MFKYPLLKVRHKQMAVKQLNLRLWKITKSKPSLVGRRVRNLLA